MKTLIVVTHLLGTGHLSRALTLGRAFAKAGHEVLIASGGMPAPQLDHSDVQLLQLAPVRSDGTNFTHLLTDQNSVATDDYLAQRQSELIKALTDFRPDILITELFPFGRRILSTEFLALLNAAQALPAPAVILSSIRDILAPPSKPAKADRADDIIETLYDAVFVHSDPQTTRLDKSWPVSDRLAPYLKYTGYVAPPFVDPHPDQHGVNEVLVSAGGGGVGDTLFQTAIAAARLMPDQQWRLLVGGNTATERVERLLQIAKGSRTIVEPARPDFRQMLHGAAASVSMCGYNTALDVLQAKTPAVLIPFDAGNEVEQTLRANSLASLPAISVLTNAELTPQTLASHVQRVIAEGPRQNFDLGFDGAAQSVQLASDMADNRARVRK